MGIILDHPRFFRSTYYDQAIILSDAVHSNILTISITGKDTHTAYTYRGTMVVNTIHEVSKTKYLRLINNLILVKAIPTVQLLFYDRVANVASRSTATCRSKNCATFGVSIRLSGIGLT